MMQVLVPVNAQLLSTTINNFENIDEQIATLSSNKLYSPGSALRGALDEALDKIKLAVKAAFENGWEFAKEKVQIASDFITECVAKFGKSAGEFKQLLIDKLNQLIQGIFDLVLGSLRSELTIGNQKFKLENIDLEQKLLLSGEIEISLINLCRFIGSGELLIKSSYAVVKS